MRGARETKQKETGMNEKVDETTAGGKLEVVSFDEVEPWKPSIRLVITKRRVNLYLPKPWDYLYWFHVSRVDTPIKLLGWVHHLLEKKWMDTSHARWFIASVTAHFGWNIYTK